MSAKHKNKKNEKKTGGMRWWSVVLLVIVSVAVMVGSGWFTADWLKNLEEQGSERAEEIIAEEEQKEKEKEEAEKTQVTPSPSAAPSPTPSDGKGNAGMEAENLENVYVSLPVVGVVGADLRVSAHISGLLDGGGTCELVLTGDGYQVTRTAAVAALPSMSTCEGFDVPLKELDYGFLDVKVKVLNKRGELIGTGKGEIML